LEAYIIQINHINGSGTSEYYITIFAKEEYKVIRKERRRTSQTKIALVVAAAY